MIAIQNDQLSEFKVSGVVLMAFELQPHLRGELVELRPLRKEDFDRLFEVASDPQIWELHPCNDRYQEAVFRAFFRDAMHSGGGFLVLDAMDGRAIGSTRFHGHDEVRGEVEIGWTFLARSHWGGAHNGEMKRLLLDHAFQYVKHVLFRIGPHNLRSQKAVEKIGAYRHGTRLDARGQESLVYRIDRESVG